MKTKKIMAAVLSAVALFGTCFAAGCGGGGSDDAAATDSRAEATTDDAAAEEGSSETSDAEGGDLGGEVVASGTVQDIKENKKSITGRYLKKWYHQEL